MSNFHTACAQIRGGELQRTIILIRSRYLQVERVRRKRRVSTWRRRDIFAMLTTNLGCYR